MSGPASRRSNIRAQTKDRGRELLQAFNGTAQSARKGWLLLITLMAYLLVAVSSVTHADLLLNTPLKLPILQIEVGLRGFFVVAPALFILVHFGVLLHHTMLAQKGEALNSMLRTEEDAAQRNHPLRLEISSYFFAQNIAGQERGTILHLLMRTMAFLTLSLLPLCLVFLFQIAFLPAHDEAMTILHRFFVLANASVLIIFAGTHSVQKKSDSWRDLIDIVRAYPSHARTSFIIAMLILFASVCVATLPSRQDDAYALIDVDRSLTALAPTKVPFNWNDQKCQEWRGDRCAFWLTAVIFEQPIDYVSGRAGLLSRNLVVTDNQTLLPKRQLNDYEPSLTLRGRDLRFATFDRSDLRRVDFTASDLSGASFRGSNLSGAIFDCAEVESNKNCTKLIQSNLTGAKLTDVTIKRAQLREIVLRETNLQGFDFSSVNLSNADLSRANLRGANFSSATLMGASLENANAEGAYFNYAAMHTSNLTNANLDGADLSLADLSGALMWRASLILTNLSNARLFAAVVRGAHIWRTLPAAEKAYTFADLAGIRIEMPPEYDMKRLKEASEELKKLPRRQFGWFSWDSLATNMTGWEEWSRSDDMNTWTKLRDNTTSLETSEVGHYLGNLACVDEAMFRGILRGRSGIYDDPNDLGYLGFSSLPRVILPQGVTKEELLQGFFSDGYYGDGFGTPTLTFIGQPELASAFYDRIKEPDCESSKNISSVTLDHLRETVEEARREAVAAPRGGSSLPTLSSKHKK